MADPEIPEQPPQLDDTQGVSGKRKAAVFGGIGAGVVALVVLVVLVSAEFSAESKSTKIDVNAGGPSTGRSAAPAWSKASLGATIVGSWASGNDLVVVTSNALTAYEVASGRQDWSWSVPAGQTICRIGQTASSPRGAFIYGTRDNCGNLQVLDLTTGKPIWSAPFNLAPSGPENLSDRPADLSIQGSYLVAPYGPYNVVDIDLSTGRSVWNTDQRDEPDLGCDIDSAVIVGTDVYYGTTGVCDRGGNQVWKRDAASAAAATAMNLPITCNEPTVLQAGGELLTVCNASEHNPSLLFAPPGSSSLSTVKASNDALGQLGLQAAATAVYGNTFYVPTSTDDLDFNEVTAIDLSNGNALWTVPMSKTETFRGVVGATSAGAVVAYWDKEHGTFAITTLAASSGAAAPETAIDTKTQESNGTILLVGDYLIGISNYAMPGNDQLAVYHLS